MLEMKIVGFVNQKGGAGKSSAAINFAHWLVLRQPKKRVLVGDCDPQGSLVKWVELRKRNGGDPLPFDVRSMVSATIHETGADAAEAEGYDFLVLDGAAGIHQVNGSIVLASDLLVIPCPASGFDLLSSSEIVDVINQLKEATSAKTFFLLRKIDRTVLGDSVAEVLKTMPFPTLHNHLAQRVTWAEAAFQGQTIFELGTNANKAVREADAVFTEILMELV